MTTPVSREPWCPEFVAATEQIEQRASSQGGLTSLTELPKRRLTAKRRGDIIPDRAVRSPAMICKLTIPGAGFNPDAADEVLSRLRVSSLEGEPSGSTPPSCHD